MAKAKKKDVAPAQIGSNIQGLQEKIKGAYERIEKLKEQRAEVNAKIKAERETIEAAGVTKMAFDAAMSYMGMSPEKREGFDTGYIIARESLGLPVKGAQADLFGEETLGEEIDTEFEVVEGGANE